MCRGSSSGIVSSEDAGRVRAPLALLEGPMDMLRDGCKAEKRSLSRDEADATVRVANVQASTAFAPALLHHHRMYIYNLRNLYYTP